MNTAVRRRTALQDHANLVKYAVHIRFPAVTLSDSVSNSVGLVSRSSNALHALLTPPQKKSKAPQPHHVHTHCYTVFTIPPTSGVRA